MSARTALRILAALAIAAYFLAFAWGGLRAGFTNDDLMNTYKAWNPPVSEHLRDTVLFWTFSESFRPVGSLFYRLLFEAWGLNPLPYRIACYALLLVNLSLAYALLRRLANSSQTAAVAVLLLAYHEQFWPIYTNTGICYDLLCFSFYTGAMLYYVRQRERRFPLPWPRVAAWAGWYLLCLNSKEMAITLPVVILIYELLEKPPEWRRPFEWAWRAGRVPLVGAVMTAMFLTGRVLSPKGLPSMGPYRPEVNARVYLEHAYQFLAYALYGPEWLTPAIGAAILAALLFAAVLWRSLPFRLGIAWVLVGILPVAFIRQRGLDAIYVALPGLALALAAVVSALARLVRLRPAAVFALVMAALVLVNVRHGRVDFASRMEQGRRIAAFQQQLRPRLPFAPKSRILFLSDPFTDGEWNSAFLVYLLSRDRTLVINRADHLMKMNFPEPLDFAAVFAWDKDRLMECAGAPYRQIKVSDFPSLQCQQR